MSGRLAGKTVLITGAAQGIGKATALACAGQGAHVWATDANADGLHGFDDAADISTLPLDVTQDGDAERAAAEAGAVDALFNIAGWVHNGTILNTDAADWDRSFAINVRGMYATSRAFLPAMLEAGGGAIVNMASVASSVMGVPSRCAYGASKAAVIGLTKSIAADYVGDNVRCNAICPGTVESPSLQDRINAYDDPKAARQAFIARQPMGRLGTAEEIAGLCVYLVSDEAAYVTGSIFTIDGGMTT